MIYDAKNIRLLTKDGYIYQENEVSDTYEIVSIDNLGEFIVDIIKKNCSNYNHGVSYLI